ncbi:MAG TPA: alkaline phosphatase family protein [Actinomycetota bacterium]|nr:alkaline phosphatase family protein [Actinomycetota bacterium]
MSARAPARRSGLVAALVLLVAGLAAGGATLWRTLGDDATDAPSFARQLCGIPDGWRARTVRGYRAERSGQIAILPRTPAYMGTAAGGWSHSGPWPYLQDVPLVFYGPGVVARRGDVAAPATSADVAPTLARMTGARFDAVDGRVLPVLRRDASRPRLVVVIVWDGGGWNALRQWPGDWPNLARMMRAGASFTDATVGSSPSVTPSVHTTIGTGAFPRAHGITGIPVRDEQGVVVDSFEKGESSRFVEVATLAERWDEARGNRALVGMVGYEPWHLGMIGQGAERGGGDRDDAAWLDIETNEWITNPDHYRLPRSLATAPGLDDDVDRLDAADGELDGAWGDQDILDDVARLEETPAFVVYHTRAMLRMVDAEGYGADRVTDFLFTNYKQIDRLGHYFNMASDQVHDALVETDRQLGVLLRALDRDVGRGRYAVVVTADHGQQPDAPAVDGYGINPREILEDVDRHFGAPITRAVWPTEVFLFDDELERAGVTVDDVARFLSDYRLRDNATDPKDADAGAGVFDPDDRLLAMAIPSRMLASDPCDGEDG